MLTNVWQPVVMLQSRGAWDAGSIGGSVDGRCVKRRLRAPEHLTMPLNGRGHAGVTSGTQAAKIWW